MITAARSIFITRYIALVHEIDDFYIFRDE